MKPLKNVTDSRQSQGPQAAPSLRRNSPFRWFMIGLAVLAVLVVGDGIQVLRLNYASGASQPAGSATLSGVRPTAAPTLDTRPTSGPVLLGAPLGPFVAKYGAATSAGGDEYTFQHATLSVLLDTNQRSLSILDTAPAHQAWSETTARSICLAFAPADRHYVRQITMLSDTNQPVALQFAYVSRALASQFPASDFNDENGDPTTPGAFGVVIAYATGSTSRFAACSTQVGLQETQGAQSMRPNVVLTAM